MNSEQCRLILWVPKKSSQIFHICLYHQSSREFRVAVYMKTTQTLLKNFKNLSIKSKYQLNFQDMKKCSHAGLNWMFNPLMITFRRLTQVFACFWILSTIKIYPILFQFYGSSLCLPNCFFFPFPPLYSSPSTPFFMSFLASSLSLSFFSIHSLTLSI